MVISARKHQAPITAQTVVNQEVLNVQFLKGVNSGFGLMTYEYNGHPVRVVVAGDDKLWVSEDVVTASGITWAGNATISTVPGKQRRFLPIVTPSGAQNVSTLSKEGLIFFLTSIDTPAAFQLLRWAISEVLPSIRWADSSSTHTSMSSVPDAKLALTTIALSEVAIGNVGGGQMHQDVAATAIANSLAINLKQIKAHAALTDEMLTKFMCAYKLYKAPVQVPEDIIILFDVAILLGVDYDGLLDELHQTKVLCHGHDWTVWNQPYPSFRGNSRPYFGCDPGCCNYLPDGTKDDLSIPFATPMGLAWLFDQLWGGKFNRILKEIPGSDASNEIAKTDKSGPGA